MDMTSIAAIGGESALTTLIGAGIGYLIKLAFDMARQSKMAAENEHRKARLTYLQSQLSEFYWPLNAGLIRDESIWKLRSKSENQDDETQQKIQEAIEQELLLPNHQKMSEIITSKLHLSGYDEVPPMFKEYLSHVAAFRALRAAGSLAPPSEMGAPWPAEFDATIKKRTVELTKQYNDLIELVIEKQ